jgi:hypothetical protein
MDFSLSIELLNFVLFVKRNGALIDGKKGKKGTGYFFVEKGKKGIGYFFFDKRRMRIEDASKK